MAIVNAVAIIITTLLFIYCATKKTDQPRLRWKKYSLQKKSVTCTSMGALGHLGFSSCVFLAQSFNPFLACYLILYGAILGFYTWLFAFCTRAYRLRYLFRQNQSKVKYAHEQRYLKHRDVKKVLRNLFAGYLVTIVLILVITVPSHQHAVNTLYRCDTTWGASVLLGMFGFFIAVITPSITYGLKDIPDAHGIRTEFWILALIGIPLFVLNAVFFFKLFPAQSNPDSYINRLFAPANWIMFFTAAAHIVTVVVPLLEYAWIKKRPRRIRRNSSTEHFDLSRPRLELTVESLQRALADQEMMQQLGELAIRDFSSENILFYEKYLELQQKIESGDEVQIADYVEIYECFIHENASFQVNISYKARSVLDSAFQNLYAECPELAPTRQATLRPVYEKDTSETNREIYLELFEAARSEVCWNIFNSVYPKLIELQGSCT
ncbi:unnamed protein product [Rhizopus stolonifer]